MSSTRAALGKKKSKSGHDVPHVDEKWLVSYSDMMTLLFGLFVMLYSIAMEKQGAAARVNAVLSQIKISDPKNQQRVDAAEVKAMQAQTQAQAQKLKQAQTQIGVLEKVALEEWNQKISLEKVLQKRTETLTQQVQKLTQELKLKEKPDQKLNRALAAARWSALILAQWENPDYDIDLQVKSPQGNWFSFKKPTRDGDPNSFVQDAAYGPATEVFKAQVHDKRPYEVKLSIYNFKGEPSPVEVKVKAALPNRDEVVKTVTLDPSKREETFQVNLYDLLFE